MDLNPRPSAKDLNQIRIRESTVNMRVSEHDLKAQYRVHSYVLHIIYNH